MLNQITTIVKNVSDFLWGWPLIILLVGTHVFMTLRTGFIQRKIGTAIRLSITKDADSDGDISPFAALTTALASTIGTGNIIGVGTAIALGGPGAVLWCWLTGVFGIATKYSESLIAVKYRVKTKDGRMLGGAMYALERGLNMKWLGVIFAILALLASVGIGSGTQVNAISNVVATNLSDWQGGSFVTYLQQHIIIVHAFVGIVVAGITCLVIFGGVKSISRVCETLVPFMALFYALGCVVILCMNADHLWETLKVIFRLAFSKGAAAGGLVGSGIMAAARYGVARGLFSNESGMGSAPIVAAAAQSRNPVRQALISATGTFWDTVVVCAMTGLVLVSSILKNDAISVSGLTGGELTTMAFAQIPWVGRPILIIGIITFAYSTILGWSYYAERCAEYLMGRRSLVPFRVVWIVILLLAPLVSLNLVWDAADILNGLMTIPNLIAVLLLSGVIAKETRRYINRLDDRDPTPIPVVDEKKALFRKAA